VVYLIAETSVNSEVVARFNFIVYGKINAVKSATKTYHNR